MEEKNENTSGESLCHVNLIAVFDEKREKVLMCKRSKEPYLGLYNLVGGKVKPGEDGMDAAYRELEEETSITKEDIELIHLMDFFYHLDTTTLEVYFGYLKREVPVFGEENELLWMDRKQDFFDQKIFAGEGNIGHMMEHIRFWEEQKLSLLN